MSSTVVSSPEAIIKDSKNLWGGGQSPYGISWGKMYMWFFLLSDAFTFSSLLIAYGTTRHKFASVWPSAADVFVHFPFVHGHIPLAYVGLMTFILIMSSVTMVLAVEAGHRNSKKEVIMWMGLTIVGGIMFLGSQAWEWKNFIAGTDKGAYIQPDGSVVRHAHGSDQVLILPGGKHVEGAEAEAVIAKSTVMQGANMTKNEYGNSQFAQFFFFITGFHGFHVFSGVVINIIIFILALTGSYDKRGHYEQVEKAGLYWHFVDLVWVFVFTFFYLV